MLKELARWLYQKNAIIQRGWNSGFGLYVGIGGGLAVIDSVVAQEFPSFALSSTILSLIIFIIVIVISYYWGLHHKRLEKEVELSENVVEHGNQ